ncbi:MAG: hypothetical protein U0794_16815 [Isosphaeraceae bacterium]
MCRGSLLGDLDYLQVESQAYRGTPHRNNTIYYSVASGGTGNLSLAIQEAGNDDITSHNLQAPGGATQ